MAENQPTLSADIGKPQTGQQLRETRRIIPLIAGGALQEIAQRMEHFPEPHIGGASGLAAPLEGMAEVLDHQPPAWAQRLCQSDQVGCPEALRQVA
jgi:hypothetical protein